MYRKVNYETQRRKITITSSTMHDSILCKAYLEQSEQLWLYDKIL